MDTAAVGDRLSGLPARLEGDLMSSYSVTADGVRLRAQPSTSAPIVVNSLGVDSPMTTVSDQVVSADGHDWRNVQTSAGQAGWVASDFLAPAQDSESFRMLAEGVRLRAEPSTSAPIVVDGLDLDATISALSDQVVTADGLDWRNVQTAVGTAGWVASEYLELVGSELPGAVGLGGFTAQAIAAALGSPLAKVTAN